MRLIVSLLIVLAITQVIADEEIDMTTIPQQELKALQQAVKFKKAQSSTQEEILQKAGGFFDNLFGKKQGQNSKIQFSRSPGSDDQEGQQLQKQMQGINQLLSSLPYEALLPRRRQPIGLLNKLMGGEEDSDEQDETNPLEQLNQILSSRKHKKQGKKFYWQNPDFKDGKRDTPYMKIFGPKSKKKHSVNVNEEDIQKLLVEAMPSLSGGKIIKLSSVPYRKGIFLNVQYQTVKEQIYTIKAKYQKKTNQLEIISMTEINVLKKVEEDTAESDDEESIEEEKVDVYQIAAPNIIVEDKKISQNEQPAAASTAQVQKIEEQSEESKEQSEEVESSPSQQKGEQIEQQEKKETTDTPKIEQKAKDLKNQPQKNQQSPKVKEEEKNKEQKKTIDQPQKPAKTEEKEKPAPQKQQAAKQPAKQQTASKQKGSNLSKQPEASREIESN